MVRDLIKTRKLSVSFQRCFAGDQSGSTAIEYALIASGISIAILAAVTDIGGEVNNLFTSVVDIF